VTVTADSLLPLSHTLTPKLQANLPKKIYYLPEYIYLTRDISQSWFGKEVFAKIKS